MKGLPAFVIFLGYAVFYYGMDQIKGGNNGFLSLVVPGKYSNQTPDNGGSSGSAGSGSTSGASANPNVAGTAPTSTASVPVAGQGSVPTHVLS
jgi:hypothetical protein